MSNNAILEELEEKKWKLGKGKTPGENLPYEECERVPREWLKSIDRPFISTTK